MTTRLFSHLRQMRTRLEQQLGRLESGDFVVIDHTKGDSDVTQISIDRVKEMLADTEQLIRIYGADG